MVAPCSPHLAWWPALACRRAAAAATAAASRPAACGLRARGMRLSSWLWAGGAAREGLHVAQVAGQHRSGALPHLAGPPQGSGAAACRHNARGGCAVCWSASAMAFLRRGLLGRVPGLDSKVWVSQQQSMGPAAPIAPAEQHQHGRDPSHDAVTPLFFALHWPTLAHLRCASELVICLVPGGARAWEARPATAQTRQRHEPRGGIAAERRRGGPEAQAGRGGGGWRGPRRQAACAPAQQRQHL